MRTRQGVDVGVVDRHEGLSAARGVLFGLLFSGIFWGLVWEVLR